jgi:hypothetical protein
VILASDRGTDEQVELVRRFGPTIERHASPKTERGLRAIPERLALPGWSDQALADFARALAMRDVVRAAVRG